MRKIKLKGVGPRSMVLQGAELFVAEYFSDSLSVVLFEDGEKDRVESILLGPSLPLTPERKGEIAFNNALLCFQNWQSCSSCHGPEARTDGFNWDLMNDGIGNPKNVRSLLLSHQRSPLGWLGVRETADNAVRAGFIHILFTTPPEAEVQSIEAYIENLQQVPSPRLINGQLSESAKRGEKIFSKSGCIDCHTPPIYTNLKKVPIGLGTGPDEGKSFVVAPLREVWRTAPYLHDGRAPTIGEAILSCCTDARNLTDAELSYLIEFIGSL
jgi:mono/diheme cytochrome c family protein